MVGQNLALLFVPISCLLGFTAIYTTRAAPSSSDVEEFVQNLLSANQFDALVDKIADRAVEKIRNIQMLRESPKKIKSHKKSRFNILRNEDASTKLTKNPDKIDKITAKAKYDEFPFDKLSLKYKLLINKKGSKSNKKIPSVQDTVGKNIRQEKPEKGKESENISDNSNDIDDEGKVTNFDHSYEHPKVENSYTNDNKNAANRYSKESLIKNTSEDRLESDKRTKDESSGDLDTNKVMPESSTTYKTNETINEETEESKELEGKSDIVEDRMETEVNIVNETVVTENSSKKIRSENGKLFTFVENSPDYDEYHEKLAKARVESADNNNEWGVTQ